VVLLMKENSPGHMRLKSAPCLSLNPPPQKMIMDWTRTLINREVESKRQQRGRKRGEREREREVEVECLNRLDPRDEVDVKYFISDVDNAECCSMDPVCVCVCLF